MKNIFIQIDSNFAKNNKSFLSVVTKTIEKLFSQKDQIFLIDSEEREEDLIQFSCECNLNVNKENVFGKETFAFHSFSSKHGGMEYAPIIFANKQSILVSMRDWENSLAARCFSGVFDDESRFINILTV